MATSEGPVSVVIPQMGVVENVLVVEWLRSAGSIVAAGEEIVIIDTNKAEVQLEAPAAGMLEILVPAGDDEVPVGTVIGRVAPASKP